MKKYLLAAAMGVMACGSLFAQSALFDNPNNRPYFGFRVGGDVTVPGKVKYKGTEVEAFKNGGGFEVGGVYNAPIVANLYVEPGVKFYYDTYKMNTGSIDMVRDGKEYDKGSIRKTGFRVPVMLGYHLDFTKDIKLSVFTGPEMEVGIKAKAHANTRSFEVNRDLYDGDNGMHRVNMMWDAGVGLTVEDMYVGVNTSYGITNMLKDKNLKFRENRVTFSVGYNF